MGVGERMWACGVRCVGAWCVGVGVGVGGGGGVWACGRVGVGVGVFFSSF